MSRQEQQENEVVATASKGIENEHEPNEKPTLKINSLGYFSREKPQRTHVNKFYHRLLHTSNHDTLQDAIVHESFFHPTVCSEWVQDYRLEINSRPPIVCFSFSALLELSLAGWLKTALMRSGSLDRNLLPCKNYSFLLLHSVWSPSHLLPVKAFPTPPHAPRLWSVVENTSGEQAIEVLGQDIDRNKKLLLTCEGCHIPSKRQSHDKVTAINVKSRVTDASETGTAASCLPDPATLFDELSSVHAAARLDIKKGSSFRQVVLVPPEKCAFLSLSKECVHYGRGFILPPLIDMHSMGKLGNEEFALSTQFSVKHLAPMQDQHLIPPPVLEILLHQAVNTYFAASLTEDDSKVTALPRALSMEAFFVNYQNLVKIFSDDMVCSVMVTATRSTNVHEYNPIDEDDEGCAESKIEEDVKNELFHDLNLDCTLLSVHGDVIAHAYNVLYIYQTERTVEEAMHSKSESELANDQTAGFRSSKGRDSVVSTDGGGMNKSKKARMKQKKQQLRESGGTRDLATAMTAEQINNQIRTISLMYVDQAVREEITDDDSLLDNGLDSLATAEFIGKLSTKFQINLPPTLVFHQPSIREIQLHIAGLLLTETVVAEMETTGDYETSSVEVPSLQEGKSSMQVSNSSVVQPVNDLDSISVVISGDEDSKSVESLSVVESHSSDEDNLVEKPRVDDSSIEEGNSPHEKSMTPVVSTLRSRINMADHGAGNPVAGNPWFSVFYASSAGDPRCRMVLCTGQAQGTAPWCSFAEILNSAGIDVYVVRIPGQFERGEEPPYEGSFADIVDGVCNGLAELGCLDDENGVPIALPELQSEHGISSTRKSPAIPLVMLGFSLGTCFTIGLVQDLQRSRGVEVSQVVSMGGLTHAKMKSLKSQTVAYTPDLLKDTLLEFFGRAPGGLHQFLETADAESISTIMRYFDEGFRYAREWMADMDANNALMEAQGLKNVLSTDFLWIVGSRDISCPSGDPGWKNFVGENNQVEILIYPGDHFFHVENPDADRAVAIDVSRCLLRKLQIYS